ncbi:hypothetical protein LOTGIDRAFT_182578 [Lottia gigantea]|uniref:HELP domain-containing protein n=1 Tax=Lottia gigantea TaxID=225164 RepID=V4BQV9_LOTGI|nr:hypothetical protein LOTGIDRAFT_182578 [Lottia gigantea]ESO91299.1 hypothetical protein LOTGIDRAFT_182578 [Lottia gigantea]
MEMDTTNRNKNSNGSQQDGLMSRSQSLNGINRKGGAFKDKRSVETTRVIINKQAREFFLPTEVEEDGRKPNKKLTLDWVYGFRGRDVEDNIKVLVTGELVYFVATVVVIYEKREQRYQDRSKPLTTELQRHYTGHTEEVTCLALHPNKRFIASGQLAGSSPEFAAHVRIWDGLTLTTYQVVGFDVFKASVKTVAFSVEAEGDYIMVIDDSEKHELSVWDWGKPKRIAKTTTTAESVTGGCFYPGDRNDKKYNNDIIITYGNKHLYFWKLFWESSNKKSGIFEEETPNVTSAAFSENGQVITGNSDGTIHIWVDTKDDYVFILSEEIPAHKKAVSSLCMKPDGVLISGGGNEIKHWDAPAGFKKLKEKTLPELSGNVRSVVLQNTDAPEGSLYIGTTKSCVLEYVGKKFSYVIQGNSDEIWAIASHPKEGSFITAGHDQLVIKWSTLNHGIKWRTQIEKPCVSVAIDPKGVLVAVGTTVGKLVLLKVEDGSEITSTQVGNAQINALSFSQDGKKLAIGAHDGFTHVFSINEYCQFTRTQSAALKNNNSFVSQVDWSVDSNFLQTVLGDYEVVYWDINNMQKRKDARIMRDIEWCSQTCSVGYALIGPWSNLENGEVVNVAGRSAKSEFVAVGDNRGRIRLYRHPSTSLQAQFRNVKPYSNNVTAITFTADDSFVLSSGGNDAALFQWVVSDLNAA